MSRIEDFLETIETLVEARKEFEKMYVKYSSESPDDDKLRYVNKVIVQADFALRDLTNQLAAETFSRSFTIEEDPRLKKHNKKYDKNWKIC